MSTFKRKGQSTKPCHGCGSTLPHWSDHVCDECAKAIKGYKTIMEERAAAGDMVDMLSKERYYALPSIGYACDSEIRDLIKRRVHQLTQWLSVPSETVSSYGLPQIFRFGGSGASKDEHQWQTVVRIRPEYAEAIGELYQAIGTALDQAEKRGHQEGRSLLLSLAGGHITTDEFNDKAIRKT